MRNLPHDPDDAVAPEFGQVFALKACRGVRNGRDGQGKVAIAQNVARCVDACKRAACARPELYVRGENVDPIA